MSGRPANIPTAAVCAWPHRVATTRGVGRGAWLAGPGVRRVVSVRVEAAGQAQDVELVDVRQAEQDGLGSTGPVVASHVDDLVRARRPPSWPPCTAPRSRTRR